MIPMDDYNTGDSESELLPKTTSIILSAIVQSGSVLV